MVTDPIAENTPENQEEEEIVVPDPHASVAPTGRAKCQQSKALIEKGSLRFTSYRSDGKHIIASHKYLKNVSKRILCKFDTNELTKQLEGKDKDVAINIIESIKNGDSISEEHKNYISK